MKTKQKRGSKRNVADKKERAREPQLVSRVSDAMAIQELTEMTERVLQSEIVEPLLRKMQFRNVQDNSGSGELGKDLVALKSDEFGHNMLYAIQIKKFKPSAKVGTSSSFGRLLDQLRQAIDEVVIDPTTNEKRRPDWCVFITPYPIPLQVRAAFHQRMKDPIFRVLRIVDGSVLLDQIQKYMPEAIGRFSMDTQYRLRVEQYTGSIHESSIAFELNEDLRLDDIYVDASVSHGDSNLAKMAGSTRSRYYEDLHVSAKDLKALYSQYRLWSQHSLNPLPKLPNENQVDLHSVNFEPLFQPFRERAREYLRTFVEMGDPDITPARCSEIAAEGISIKRDIRALRKIEVVKNLWNSMIEAPSLTKPNRKPVILLSSSLIKIRECLFVLGAPGAGKTTLLRRLSQAMARTQRGYLPLFVPLISVNQPSYDGIVNACLNELKNRGFRSGHKELSRAAFIRLVDSGRFRLCLDGLDEAGSTAGELMGAVDALARKHERCKVILSSRDTFGFSDWDRALTVHLSPFSDEQVRAFIVRWFTSEPSSVEGLISWLSVNERMREAARTPLMAALLCSLFQIQADLPTTEIELYERRFDLLLGRWDQAKRIQPLKRDIRKRYLHFLMAFAFYLHQAEKRSAANEEAMHFAKRFYVKQFHQAPDALVIDCVRRGLLEREDTGHLSFGHLTYQEYLASEWLAQHNPTGFLWSRILTPWWKKTLEFYAARKLDITPLVKIGLRYRGEGQSMERICELVELAPLTSENIMLKFRRLLRTEALAAFNWGAPPPKLSLI